MFAQVGVMLEGEEAAMHFAGHQTGFEAGFVFIFHLDDAGHGEAAALPERDGGLFVAGR